MVWAGRSHNRVIAITLILFALFLSSASAHRTLDPAEALEIPTIPGILEATGTHFALNDSEYLNIFVTASEEITLRLESVPEVIVLHVTSSSPSTALTISGLKPNTTYYKFEDDYHSLVVFTSDENGSYTFSLNLSSERHVWIQPRASTKFISEPGGGDCSPPIGTWNATTKVCTLTQDVGESIQIDSDGVTLDCAGYTVAGIGTGYGILISGKTNVAIENCAVRNFSYGIYLDSSNYNNLTNNNASSNSGNGINLYSSNYNTITNNNASSNFWFGIDLHSSNYNTLTNNNASSNSHSGIFISSSSNNTLTSNIASGNFWLGIVFQYSTNNTLTNDIANSNYFGTGFEHSSNNMLTGNTASGNSYGIFLDSSSNNNFTENNASYNGENGIYVYASNNTTVSGGNASYNNNGIFFDQSFNNTIASNYALNNTNDGIKLVVSNYSNISFNTPRFNTVGIHVTSSSNFTIANNTCGNNTLNDIVVDPSRDFMIIGNLIFNSNIGIAIIQSFGGTILKNLIQFNSVGISFDFSTEINISDDIIQFNNIGISSNSSTNVSIAETTINSNNIGVLLNSSTNITTENTTISNSTSLDFSLNNSAIVLVNTTFDTAKVSFVNSTIVISAIIDIDPDVLNLKSKGKWITAYIEIPNHDLTKVNISTVLLNDTIPAEPKPTEIGDYDQDGIPDLMVKFNRNATQSIVNTGNVTLTATGKIGEVTFAGSDTIVVIGMISLSSWQFAVIPYRKKKVNKKKS
jgi:parallel beta-helix repeat protein